MKEEPQKFDLEERLLDYGAAIKRLKERPTSNAKLPTLNERRTSEI